MQRVRTGCVSCRARKVKCDERQPTCRRCDTRRTPCMYEPPGQRKRSLVAGKQNGQGSSTAKRPSTPPITSTHTETERDAHLEIPESVERSAPFGLEHSVNSTGGSSQDEESHAGGPVCTRRSCNSLYATIPCHELPPEVPASSASRIEATSRIIYLTLSMDISAVSDTFIERSISYFINSVDCHFITPFDPTNWSRMKLLIAQLATTEDSITKALLAVQAVHSAQVYRLSTRRAISLYQAAATMFEPAANEQATDFETVVINFFLLCLFLVMVPAEDAPDFARPKGLFSLRLEAWSDRFLLSPVAQRLCAWIQLLDTACKHSAAPGIVSDQALAALRLYFTNVTSLSALGGGDDLSALGDVPVDAHMTTFHAKVQIISSQIADLTHHRRSRVTPSDQEEVSVVAQKLKAEMCSIWSRRPALLRSRREGLHRQMGAGISEHLISAARVCMATYFAEIVALGRTLGDPPFPTSEARQALTQIRELIDGDWNTRTGSALNPGYLRPLVMYGIESFEETETAWAAQRLRQIDDPMSRSAFFASLIEYHSESQRAQHRRVTLKFFCYRAFDVSLPLM